MTDSIFTYPFFSYLFTIGVAYFIGGINPAIYIGKLHGIDIRKEGSGNAGMTNTIRVIGLKAGIAVFAIDVIKGVLAVLYGVVMTDDVLGGIAGFAFVVLGHCFPAAYNFKGGKGVSSSLGAALALNWQSALAVLAVAGVVFLISGRRMSIASLTAAVSYPAFVWFMVPDRRVFYFAIAAVVFLLFMHRDNIKRISKGEESSLTIGHHGTNREDHTSEDDEEGKAD